MSIENIIFNWSYAEIFFATLAYFIFLYFGLAPVFEYAGRFLESKNIVTKIASGDVTKKQRLFEIQHSAQSIFIFGFSSLPVVYFIRNGGITLLPDTIINTLVGVLVLTLWNEVHFFIVHRIMHLPFFMKNVHAIHHRSAVPTVWSVYSFHWFEAFLLSTVPLTIIPFISFNAMAIALYPLASILLNYAGHCNYRFGSGQGPAWRLFGTRHAEHHFKRRENYGFATNVLDWLYSNFTQKKK